MVLLQRAIYCTRPIVLDNPSTAIEIRLTSNVRSDAEVEVYFRASSSEEVRDINDLSWVHLMVMVAKILQLHICQNQITNLKNTNIAQVVLQSLQLSKLRLL